MCLSFNGFLLYAFGLHCLENYIKNHFFVFISLFNSFATDINYYIQTDKIYAAGRRNRTRALLDYLKVFRSILKHFNGEQNTREAKRSRNESFGQWTVCTFDRAEKIQNKVVTIS